MKSAAVSQLKATLSKYLERVKAGEEVIITERGKPIAKIVPFPVDASTIPPRLVELARAGMVTLGPGKLPDRFWELDRPEDARGLALKALLEERETGR